jgi:squalene synthase HpnC
MAAAALELAPPGAPDAPAVMARAGAENFPVAMRLLAPSQRRALLAVYGFARLADELGDEYDGDRLAALDWLERELGRAYAGRLSGDDRFGWCGGVAKGRYGGIAVDRGSERSPLSQPAAAPLLVTLQAVLAEHSLSREPFLRLIEANRVDQRIARYETWQQLQSYCELSANPVGELVLEIFELRTPERLRLSDAICTGLQLTEHLQDVGEDLRLGRVYLPQEDLARFGCSQERLGQRDPGTRAALRQTVAFELARARELLWAGAPLAASVEAWRPRLAIAAFAAGGLAALEQIERAGCEVLDGVAPAGRGRRARWLGRVLRRARSAS